MSSINSVTVSGNLGHDADCRETTGGMFVANFTVAVNERVRNKQTGQYEDVPNWVRCCLFGNYARALAPSLVKGARVAVQGSLRVRAYDKDGQMHVSTEVIARTVDVVRANGKQQEPPQAQADGNHDGYLGIPYPGGSLADTPPAGVYDEDIPF